MPIVEGTFYCPMQCTSGHHRNARYILGLGHEVPLRTYYRHRNQRRRIGRASLLTADEQTVSSTSNPAKPYIDVEFDSQQGQSGPEFEDDVQHDDIADGQDFAEGDDESDEDFADVVADQEERSDVQSVLSCDDLSGDPELDILDGDLEMQDDSNCAVQPPTSGMISGTYTCGRPTIRRLSADDTESIRWLLFKVMHVLDNVGFWLLGVIPNIATQSLHKCRVFINDCTGLSPIKYDCCHLTPCVCYFGEYEDYQECPKCGSQRFANHLKKPNKTFSYIPLEPRIRAIFGQKDLSKMVQEYPSEIMSKNQNGTLADFWNGDILKRLQADGFLKHPTEIALTLSIDGVQLVKTKSHQTWPIMGVVMNFPPSMRYNKENILLFGTIPGPKMPGDIYSFLGPLLQEIKVFSERGIEMWNEHQNCMSTVKVHLCLVTGGQPAIAKLMCLKGHNARWPCRFCFIEGVVAFNKQNYYPFLSIQPDAQGIRQLNMRSNMKEDIELCHQIQDNCTYKALGISGRSPLVDFPTLYWPQSFPVDVMHLILEGIVPRTFNIWVEAGKQKKKTAESEPLEFGCSAKPPVDDLAGLGADIKKCAPEVPAALARCPEDVYVHHQSYRAQNWFDFLQLFVHPLLAGRASMEVRTSMALLARIYAVATQQEISREDLRWLVGAVRDFVESYEHLYTDPTVCTSNLHGILHLADCIRSCGPAWGYWQFTMEKTCGNVVGWLRGKKLKDENLANAILLNEQVNLLQWINPDVCLTWEAMFMRKQVGSSVPTFSDQVKRAPVFTTEQVTALLDYLSTQSGSAVGHELVRQPLKESVEYRKYCPNSEDMVTSSLESSGSQGRCRRYVRCLNDKRQRFFGEIDRFFSLQWPRRIQHLALIKVFENVRYSEEEDGLYGRVQEFRDRNICLACISVSEIECTVGIIANRFTHREYILDRNWIDFDPYGDELGFVQVHDDLPDLL